MFANIFKTKNKNNVLSTFPKQISHFEQRERARGKLSMLGSRNARLQIIIYYFISHTFSNVSMVAKII